jgi:serine/threonine protein kinase
MTAFGRYELRGTLGAGGFATVYRAFDPALGREVALKALHPALAADRSVRRRFLEEARALAGLRHPNIAVVHDVGEAEGRPFFAMELIEGQTLAELMSQRTLPPAQVVAILRDLCAAVDYLHNRGLVHRDIKTANVMVERGGRVVLMDFGIARALAGTRHTTTGQVLGSLESIAPEQIRGEPARPPADIYALGILTYQLLGGRPPFLGDTAYLLHAHLVEPPPPLERLRPGLPAHVYAVIQAALAKQPARRPPSAGRFAAALAGTGLPVTPTDAPTVRTRRPRGLPPNGSVDGSRSDHRLPVPLIGVGAAAVLIAAAILGVFLLGGDERPPETSTRTTGPITITSTSGASLPSVELKVCDNVVTCKDGEFVVEQGFAACFAPPAGNADMMHVVATEVDSPPRTVSDPTIVARSAPIPPGGSGPCYGVPLTVASLAPGPKWVWLLRGTDVIGRGGFRALEPVPPPTPTPTPPSTRTPTVTPAIAISSFDVRNIESWARSQGGLQGCYVYQGAQGIAGLRLRVTPQDDESSPRDSMLLPLVAAAGSLCSELMPAGTVPPGNYLARLYDDQWQVHGAYAFTVSSTRTPQPRTPTPTRPPTATPTPSPTPTPPPGVMVAGDWDFIDTVHYGTGIGYLGTFRITLRQQGNQVTGSGDGVELTGLIENRILKATYRQGAHGGEFYWLFTADGTRFEGAYTNSVGNGGTSYGRRRSGAVSTTDQATIWVIGPGVNDRNRTARLGSEIYICFTVSKASRVILRGLISNQVFYDKDDDGTGDCLGPYTAEPVGLKRYGIEMLVNGNRVAQDEATLMIFR